MQETAEPEDLLSDSLHILYGYTPITHASAGSLFRYTLHPLLPTSSESNSPIDANNANVITLVTPNTLANNWALHASSIWTSALYVADHLDGLHLPAHIRAAADAGWLPLRVLELGAGAGLPSIVIAKTHPGSRVVVTASDYPDVQLIAALEENVRRNGVADRCGVVPHAWGSDPSPFWSNEDGSEEEGFDVVVAADTLWNSDLHGSFLKTLQQVLRRTKDARIYLIAGLHTGRYTLHAFMQMIEDYGLVLVSVVEREVNGTLSRLWDVSRAEGEDEKERRHWVVDMELKWKNIT
ncbi:hypothetical protein PHLGIDRAFT_30157 [Phlebiopsis gigantea 11061_1 CR5-6]|uniref:Nicotinamide N-methyltransferase n=1 Tax=Phlebiopsis gigantea (strain 11061_1 CR5-6) TaxID=745531 RepID=A0A0C3NPS1_PHLG1|nr:hypothetical protein PHLGIDRAFT_30157 [Phlebiopsis gigantea 11061_1 CR5-6]